MTTTQAKRRVCQTHDEDVRVQEIQIREKKERNRLIIQYYQEGYSKHMIAKVLGMAQSMIDGVVKRMSR